MKPSIRNKIEKFAKATFKVVLISFTFNGIIRQFFEDFGVSKDEYGESYFISLVSLALAFLFSIVKATLRPTLWLNLKAHFKSHYVAYKRRIFLVMGVITKVLGIPASILALTIFFNSLDTSGNTSLYTEDASGNISLYTETRWLYFLWSIMAVISGIVGITIPMRKFISTHIGGILFNRSRD